MTNGTKGEVSQYMNVASMRSHGEEFAITSKNFVGKDFQWTTDFIFSHVKTKVTSLDTRKRIIDMITGSGFAKEGYAYRSLFSMDYRGLTSSGIPTFINQKGDLVTSNIDFQSYELGNLVYEGPTDPTFTGSLGNVFSYKGLHLNIFATYAFGNKMRLDPAFSSYYSDLNAMPKEFKNRWTIAGDEAFTDVPAIADLRQIQADSRLNRAYNAYNRSTARVAKGDFIRMKEISLSYDFPQRWISYLHLNTVNLKLQATNLFLIYSDKKLNGQDPEFFNAGGVAIPMARQFTMTLRVGL